MGGCRTRRQARPAPIANAAAGLATAFSLRSSSTRCAVSLADFFALIDEIVFPLHKLVFEGRERGRRAKPGQIAGQPGAGLLDIALERGQFGLAHRLLRPRGSLARAGVGLRLVSPVANPPATGRALRDHGRAGHIRSILGLAFDRIGECLGDVASDIFQAVRGQAALGCCALEPLARFAGRSPQVLAGLSGSVGERLAGPAQGPVLDIGRWKASSNCGTCRKAHQRDSERLIAADPISRLQRRLGLAPVAIGSFGQYCGPHRL